MTLQDEIDALHRIADFDERFGTDCFQASARFFYIFARGDTLHLQVDFYTQRVCARAQAGLPFDAREAHAFEDEVLEIETTPVTRAAFKFAHQAARTVLSGRTILIDGVPLSRDSYLEKVRAAAEEAREIVPVQVHFETTKEMA